MSILQNYPGSKGGDGVYQTIINHIPPHDNYYELFLGSGQIFKRKRKAFLNHLSDIDQFVIEAWEEEENEESDTLLYNEDWRTWLYQDFSSKPRARRFFYLDPPYPMTSRSTQRNLYKHEMHDQDHEELLRRLVDLDFQNWSKPLHFMISTYPNAMYENALQGWYKHEFNAQTRGGVAREVIYMNYSVAQTGLHEYTYYGADYRKRELIKDRQDTIIRKLRKLQQNDPLEFNAALHRIQSEFNLQISKP